MSLRDLSASHLRLISLYRTRHTVRGGAGLVFLMITLLFGLSVAQIVLAPVEKMMAQQAKDGQEADPKEVVAVIVKIGRHVIQWTLGIQGDENADPSATNRQDHSPPNTSPMALLAGQAAARDPWTTFLLDDRPALLSIIFLILIFGMPLLISFLAFNQISGDVQSRGLRYVLLRTARANVFFGRFLGTAFFSTLVIAIIIATITFYLGVNIKIYPAGLLVAWALHGFLALAVLMLPYIALCSLISVSVDSPFVSLILAKLAIGGVWLFAVIGSHYLWKPTIHLKYALPWGLQNHLLHPDLTHSLPAALACLGYMLVFLILGYHRFETRDL